MISDFITWTAIVLCFILEKANALLACKDNPLGEEQGNIKIVE